MHMRKSTGWTQERRARQAEMIKKWKPWEKATGPKTENGKARSSNNAYKGGEWKTQRELTKMLNQCFRDHIVLLKSIGK